MRPSPGREVASVTGIVDVTGIVEGRRDGAASRSAGTWVPVLVAMALLALPTGVEAQEISGRLLDGDSDRPVPLGLVMMYTEAGDSITSTISDGLGRFRVESPEPGSFVLVAAALGYEETRAGVFELGEGASMEVEYRLPSEPLPMDAFLVSVNQPLLDHHLVRNGFVRRLQRGLGKFITPHDIAESSARSTESLLTGIPQVRVGMVRAATGGLGVPAPHLGETVQIAGPMGRWCQPMVFVDGMKILYDPSTGLNLSAYANIADVEAVEVYRRPAEIPVEFPAVQQMTGGSSTTGCGVLVLWTKRGPAPGSRPLLPGGRRADGGTLPAVSARGVAPAPGEMIRFDIDPTVAAEMGITTPVQGTLRQVDDGMLVATDSISGRPLAVPVESVGTLQVSRQRGAWAAWQRGIYTGGGFGIGMWSFLTLLCEWSCGPGGQPRALLPAVATAVFVGGLVVWQGPGNEWVETPLPALDAGSPAGGVGLSLRVPLPHH